MSTGFLFSTKALALPVSALGLTLLSTPIQAIEPCGDYGECKVIIETNSTDGDVGFHFLVDGEKLHSLLLRGPDGRWLFSYQAYGALRQQTVTETFVESDEPLCWYDPEGDMDEVVTLADFLSRYDFGKYKFLSFTSEHRWARGSTLLTNLLPAAPLNVALEITEDEEEEDELDYTLTWQRADDGEGHLGRCSGVDADGDIFDYGLYNEFQAMNGELFTMVERPDRWEIVLEPDFNDDPEEASATELGLAKRYNGLKFTSRIAGNSEELAIEIPDEFLAGLPSNTPVKGEVGAIAGEDNATFTEITGLCVNPDEEADNYCEEEDGEEE